MLTSKDLHPLTAEQAVQLLWVVKTRSEPRKGRPAKRRATDFYRQLANTEPTDWRIDRPRPAEMMRSFRRLWIFATGVSPDRLVVARGLLRALAPTMSDKRAT
jgi:hypothetical protein